MSVGGGNLRKVIFKMERFVKTDTTNIAGKFVGRHFGITFDGNPQTGIQHHVL